MAARPTIIGSQYITMPIEEKSLALPNGAVWLRRFARNLVGRDFVVGDIHGCLTELWLLLSAVNFDKARDRLFSVGDLADRGPLSLQALKLLAEPWFFASRGNHEQMILDHWRRPSANSAEHHAWASALPHQQIKELSLMIEALPHVLKIGQGEGAFYVLHAELWADRGMLTEAMVDECSFGGPQRAVAKVLWSRSVSDAHEEGRLGRIHHPGLPRIFCGHSIKMQPTAIGRCIYLDTGAFVPYTDPTPAAQDARFGLTLFEPQTMRSWLAPTAERLRGTVAETRTGSPRDASKLLWSL